MKKREVKCTVSKQHPKKGNLGTGSMQPGDCVAVDQFVVKVPGRLPHTAGKEKIDNQYTGGTIFVDLVSGFTFVKMQVSLRAGENLLAKEEFENTMLDHGATVRKYHGDNGIFVSKAWREHCDDRGQAYDFSGVGAHHQNANAERAIQTVSYWARAMMVNAAIHWPEKGGDQSLWPFAMLYATWLFNRLPGYDTGVTPLELLTQQKSDHADLRRAHVWGAPTYVLDPKLQDDKKIPKWNRRSRRGQFLGFSDRHSSLVATIRNLATGYISPQFHVIHDDRFETVPNLEHAIAIDDETVLAKIFENGHEDYFEYEYDENKRLVYKPPPLAQY